MPTLILAVCVLAGAWLLVRGFLGSDPKAVARMLRLFALAAAGGAVAYLAATRQLGAALGLAVAILPLVWRGRAILNRLRAAAGPRPGQTSDLKTAYLHAVLDHDSGTMSGEVRQGRFAGHNLANLAVDDLILLIDECRAGDPPSVAVLEAYLDRTHGPDWREQAARRAGEAPSSGGTMSRDEAFRVLGLAPGASPEAVKEAHRRLMKQFHPDHGGSDYIAAKLNQAKDRLLGS